MLLSIPYDKPLELKEKKNGHRPEVSRRIYKFKYEPEMYTHFGMLVDAGRCSVIGLVDLVFFILL